MVLDLGGVFLGIAIAVLGFVVVVLVCVIVLRLLAFVLPPPRDDLTEPEPPAATAGDAAPAEPDAPNEEVTPDAAV